MKKIQTIILLLIATSTVIAQHPNKKKVDKEKIKAMKIAFITEKLALTPEEAQVFWPIYNEYDAKREALRKEMRPNRKEKEAQASLTEEQVAKKIEEHFDLRQQELNLDKAYHQKFIKILPIKKVSKLYLAEHEFKRELLKKMKGTHKNSKNHPPGALPH